MPNKKTPQVEVLPIEEGATVDPYNLNQHTQKGGAILENSLRKRGAARSIASAGANTKVPVTFAGSHTLEKAVEAGFNEIVNVYVTGDQLVNVVRTDVVPGSPEFYALGIEDNVSAVESYNPDTDMAAVLLAGENSVLKALTENDDLLSGMVDDLLNVTPAFTPSADPTFSTAKVVDEDVIDAKAAMDERFQTGQKYLEVICPHSAQTFYISEKDVKGLSDVTANANEQRSSS